MSQLFFQWQHALDIDLHDDVPVFPNNNNQPLQGNEQQQTGIYMDEIYDCIDEMLSNMRQETTKPCYLLNIRGLYRNGGGYEMTLWTDHPTPPSEPNNIPVVLVTADKKEERNMPAQHEAWRGAAYQVMEFLSNHFDICVQPFIAEKPLANAPESEDLPFPGSDVIRERIQRILSWHGFEDVNVQVFVLKPRCLYDLEFEDLNINIHDYEFTAGGWW